MRDITQRKQLEAQLVQSQKIECVGQLAGGIAHDFNNLLTAIAGYTHMALSVAATDDKLIGYLSQINQATERATNLTRQLLAFSRRQIISPQVINLNDVVASTEQILRRLITENIKLSTSLAPDLGPVKIDPTQVEQVLINLAVNARDAMPYGGDLTIKTSNMTLSKREARLYPDLSPGPFVQLCVADTGIGMDKVVQARVFEPFFTTKEEGKGTGLGLSMCYGIVKQNQGHIGVESQPGQGSTFKILIPRVEQPATPISLEKENQDLLAGNEAILLVEDDSLVRGLGAEVLRQHGYKVLEAEDGREALEIAQLYNGEIQLLLTDVVMPNMSVAELAQRLKVTRTEIKVLFTSGYADGSIVQQGVLEPGVEFMEKPYSPADLLERVREVLDH
jgi:nitrogen-specific signal transduction histidine kinase/CheY-like chemotaxis protein